MPVVPEQTFFPQVSGLSAQLVDGVAYLSWKAVVPQEYGSRQCVFKVFRARQPLSGDKCDGCPLDFREVGEVASAGSVKNDDGSVLARYREKLQKGGSYTYYVVCSCNGALVGRKSKRVVIVYE